MLAKLLKVVLLGYALYFLFGAFMAPHAAHTHQFELADHYYETFSASCQQQASRSFWLEGYPMALCARCLGTYIGFILSGLIWLISPRKFTLKLFLLLLVPGLGEKITEFLGWAGNNEIRFISGIFLGGAILSGLALICRFLWRLWNPYESEEVRLSGPY